jgi:ribonucleoside-diphosphate reductase alpha chain
MIRKRPTIVHGTTKRIQTGCGKLYITLNRDDDGHPIEVFIRLGKAGGCASSQTESLGRLISIMLKHSIGIEEVVKQLSGIGCHQPMFIGEGKKTLSCADAVAQALVKILGLDPVPEKIVDLGEGATPLPIPLSPIRKRAIKEEEKSLAVEEVEVTPQIDYYKLYQEVSVVTGAGACPDCGASLAMEDGCAKCYSCGFSKC